LIVDAAYGDIDLLKEGLIGDEGDIVDHKLKVVHEEVESEDKDYLCPYSAFPVGRFFQAVKKRISML
jgi:hypothetical protein